MINDDRQTASFQYLAYLNLCLNNADVSNETGLSQPQNQLLFPEFQINEWELEYPATWGYKKEDPRTHNQPFYFKDSATHLQQLVDAQCYEEALGFSVTNTEEINFLQEQYPNLFGLYEVCRGRILMETAIVYRKMGEFEHSQDMFEQSFNIAFSYKNLPLAVELIRHSVALEIDKSRIKDGSYPDSTSQALKKSVAALVIAGKMKRKDAAWFADGVVKSVKNDESINSKYLKLAELLIYSNYFSQGIVNIAQHKIKRVKNILTAKMHF